MMKLRFATQTVFVVAASLLVAACGSGPSPGSSVLPAANAQSALRAPAALLPTPAPTPYPPCYCPPVPHHVCPAIACLTNDAAARTSAATPSPTPLPPCYCPPGHHACPQCIVSEAHTTRGLDVAQIRYLKARSPGRFSAA
jgi:hypothetical protein